jgi:uncharacterized paraquat-inducible protein A
MNLKVHYGRFFVLHLFCLSLTLVSIFIGFTTFDVGVFSPFFAALALYTFSLGVVLEVLLATSFALKLLYRQLHESKNEWSDFSGQSRT